MIPKTYTILTKYDYPPKKLHIQQIWFKEISKFRLPNVSTQYAVSARTLYLFTGIIVGTKVNTNYKKGDQLWDEPLGNLGNNEHDKQLWTEKRGGRTGTDVDCQITKQEGQLLTPLRNLDELQGLFSEVVLPKNQGISFDNFDTFQLVYCLKLQILLMPSSAF